MITDAIGRIAKICALAVRGILFHFEADEQLRCRAIFLAVEVDTGIRRAQDNAEIGGGIVIPGLHEWGDIPGYPVQVCHHGGRRRRRSRWG